mgnify:CR=1 FL=1
MDEICKRYVPSKVFKYINEYFEYKYYQLFRSHWRFIAIEHWKREMKKKYLNYQSIEKICETRLCIR